MPMGKEAPLSVNENEHAPDAKNQEPVQSEREDLAKAVSDSTLVKAQAEAELAKIKGFTQGLKEIFETPGWAALLHGAGQWLTLSAENTKTLNEQEHERQKLKLVQEHERAMQVDRLNTSAQQRREVLGLILVFGATLLAVVLVVSGLVAIKWGWIDEKTATIACLIVGTVFTQARNWASRKSTPPSNPSGLTP
ncbi:hypothetical protein F0U61_06485 [Archangium violaceum]|uniref:hypothetical protein n=1 Tax=Archangium violaceum TaxID=83451 RepID=UPI002B2F4B5F|nr:hypothetical protein F0U61_06485 [Archangium violaceum]